MAQQMALPMELHLETTLGSQMAQQMALQMELHLETTLVLGLVFVVARRKAVGLEMEMGFVRE
jgi:hypothetical protein